MEWWLFCVKKGVKSYYWYRKLLNIKFFLLILCQIASLKVIEL